MARLILAWIFCFLSGNALAQFDADIDLVSLHFDNTLDRADIHSSVADLMVVENFDLITLVIGGTYGTLNADQYDEQSPPWMDDVWAGEWINADADRQDAIDTTFGIWAETLSNGGEIWVAEGGPSDFTAAVTRLLQDDGFDTRDTIHIVQHRLLNENNTDPVDLAYIQDNTDYIQIDDGGENNETANFLQDGGSQAFVDAMADSFYDLEWSIAFDYLDPEEKLDFSDTVALLHILGVSTDDVANTSQFANQFAGSDIPAAEEDSTTGDSSASEDESIVDTENDLTDTTTESENIADSETSVDDEDLVDEEVITDDDSILDDEVLTDDDSILDDEVLTDDDSILDDDVLTDDDSILDDDVQTDDDSILDDEVLTDDDSILDDEVLTDDDSILDDEVLTDDDSTLDDEATVSVESSADNESSAEGTGPRQIEFGVRLPQCVFTDSDSDGDGFGWELNSSCIVPGSGIITLFTFPACDSALADLDGDGWGWENNTSCLVVEGE